ncbi:MAG: 1-acyl-sn-glycerol-3-phosphate acyltransferase [Candidatus Hydrogenedentes bacterium]|nr:1-acyl-sn-glycerol-3-phosphate acyltransferase [Candidatus Hydrogenedentota bacterium]
MTSPDPSPAADARPAASKVKRPWRTVPGVIRFIVRISVLGLWTGIVYVAIVCVAPFGLVSATRCRKAQFAIARAWAHSVPRLLGLRVTVVGTPPSPPFLLVTNHLCWLDGFVTVEAVEPRFVAMAEAKGFFVVGTLMRAGRVIWADRSRSDEVPYLNDQMEQTMDEGHGVMFCPEGVVSPGRDVRRFRAALLECAARSGRAVHYAAITYRTPEGYAPPSEAILFGPDPYYRTADGQIPESELELWGPERSMFLYVVRLLSMPRYEAVITFGEEPIAGPDRITLANALQAAVRGIFTPVE